VALSHVALSRVAVEAASESSLPYPIRGLRDAPDSKGVRTSRVRIYGAFYGDFMEIYGKKIRTSWISSNGRTIRPPDPPSQLHIRKAKLELHWTCMRGINC
jgi:hypothetical protein